MIPMAEVVEMEMEAECKGTSIHFLTSSLPSYSPSVHMYPPPHLCTISRDYTQSNDFLEVDSPEVIEFHSPLSLKPEWYQTSCGCIRTDPRDATAPSAITWIPIYRRLGTRRLGIVYNL
jgi:hypothetical protein